MSNYWAKLFLTAVSFFTIPLCCFAIKSNDFTKSSAVGSRRFQQTDRTSGFDGKTSQFGDKKLDTKQYYDSSRKANVGNERSRWSGEISNIEASSRAQGASKKFGVPEYHGDTSAWRLSEKKSRFANANKFFSKKYEGKIDIDKRNTTYQNFIKDYYGELVDRSMEDINKYYSRTSVGSNDKFFQKAGGKLRGEDEEGFFDFLFSDEKVKRRPVSFRGVDNSFFKSATKKEETSTKANEEAESTTYHHSYVPVSQTSEGGKRKLLIDDGAAEKVIDAEQAKSFRFLNVPEQFRSKATIKVKVKD